MGYSSSTILVSAAWLQTHLQDHNLMVLDCRWRLGDPDYGRRVFAAGHIPGSRRADMERDLSAPPGKYGGRHPLPTPRHFEARMRQIGLNPDSTVVVYDDDAAGAARAWWCLTYFGHPAVHILDGGIGEWLAQQGQLESGPEPPPADGMFKAVPDPRLVVDYSTVDQLRGYWPLVDARAPERYHGWVEPIDTRAGHIPGAVNLPYAELLIKNQRYRSPADIRRLVDACVPQTELDPIVYCGSGVTACVLAAAMRSVGMSPLLYSGSWSDWISHESAPIAASPPGERQE